MEFEEEEGLFSNYTDTKKNYSSDFLDDDISPITDFQSKKNTKKIESQPINEKKETKKFGFSKEMENDKNYMKSKMMYFNRLNVGRSQVKEVREPNKLGNDHFPIRSAPQSNPIPISDNENNSIFDPQMVNTISSTFVPPHEMIKRSEFSVWDKDRKKVPKKYNINN